MTATRYYDGHLDFNYTPPIPADQVPTDPIRDALKAFASSAQRLEAHDGDAEEITTAGRTTLDQWANEWGEKLKGMEELRSEEGTQYAALRAIRIEAEGLGGVGLGGAEEGGELDEVDAVLAVVVLRVSADPTGVVAGRALVEGALLRRVAGRARQRGADEALQPLLAHVAGHVSRAGPTWWR